MSYLRFVEWVVVAHWWSTVSEQCEYMSAMDAVQVLGLDAEQRGGVDICWGGCGKQ